jgi:hypothetical protein
VIRLGLPLTLALRDRPRKDERRGARRQLPKQEALLRTLSGSAHHDLIPENSEDDGKYQRRRQPRMAVSKSA